MRHFIYRLLAAVVLLATPASFAQDQTGASSLGYSWTSLSGTWRGQGLLRASPNDALEQGVCRFDVVAQSDQKLSINGRCATAGQTGQLSTELTRDSMGTITGTAQSALLTEPVVMTGEQVGSSISLSSGAPVSVDGILYVLSSHINGWAREDQFSLIQHMASEGQDPEVVLQMNFNRSD